MSTAEIAGHKCLGVGFLHMVVVGHLKVCHKLVVSLGVLRKEVVESCMIEIEVCSARRVVGNAGCMIETETETDLHPGHIGLAGEDCIVYEPFRWVDKRLGVPIQSIHPVALHEKNIHKWFPATKCQSFSYQSKNSAGYTVELECPPNIPPKAPIIPEP